MRYPVSEALDRYSILWLKRFFGCDVDAEFEAIENYLRDWLSADWQLVRNSIQLGTCNALQWMLEECISPLEDDECVAQSALEIRRSNLQRVAAKNALAQQLGGGFQDQRVRYPGGETLMPCDIAFRERVMATPGLIEEHRADVERQTLERIGRLGTDLRAISDRNADACDYRASGKFDLAAFDAERLQREEETRGLIEEAEAVDTLYLARNAARLHNEWVSACGPTEAERAEAEARYYDSIAFAAKSAPSPDTPIGADPLEQWRDLPKHEADDPSA